MQGSETASAAVPSTRVARVENLRLNDFRNFDELRCEFPPEGVAIIGPNGSGKTNLLEAIYYLEIFRSFRGAKDAELVRFGEDVFRIEATIATGDAGGAPASEHGEAGRVGRSRQLAAAYRKTGRRKKVEVDRAEPPRLSEAIGKLGAVVFSLEDVEIVKGSPGRRRRFLNIVLSLVEPGYVDALQRYRSILGQRNEALREGEDPATLEAWTDGLVEAGARVMAARDAWLATRAEAYGRYHAAVSGGDDGTIVYEPSVGWGEDEGPSPAGSGSGESAAGESAEIGGGSETRRARAAETWAERFRAALRSSSERERRRGTTVVGPHRDDVAFEGEIAPEGSGGRAVRDLRTYGSGGQQRTAALALRLAEADSLRASRDREPVYLLDDVFAELDRDRSARLIRLLEEGRSGQVILTAPKAADVELRGGLEEWRIDDGEVTPA